METIQEIVQLEGFEKLLSRVRGGVAFFSGARGMFRGDIDSVSVGHGLVVVRTSSVMRRDCGEWIPYVRAESNEFQPAVIIRTESRFYILTETCDAVMLCPKDGALPPVE